MPISLVLMGGYLGLLEELHEHLDPIKRADMLESFLCSLRNLCVSSVTWLAQHAG
jgi:hypothetical protein